MPAPIDDDENEPQIPNRQDEVSFTTWGIMGGVLVLLYVLAILFLRST